MDVKVSEGEIESATATVTVINDGKSATDDVLQIYVQDTGYELAIPKPCLAGFERIHLEAGQEEKVVITLPRRAFTSVDNDGNRKVFSKSFKVFAGFGQPDKRTEELTGVKAIEKDVLI